MNFAAVGPEEVRSEYQELSPQIRKSISGTVFFILDVCPPSIYFNLLNVNVIWNRMDHRLFT
ncbi:MAG: hypothetical protein CMG71_05870 [Candidatus Marinimicrobia bacterium]|nr:hypothetical protein [Candidatus Neomarinimicrobiota bacterium]